MNNIVNILRYTKVSVLGIIKYKFGEEKHIFVSYMYVWVNTARKSKLVPGKFVAAPENGLEQ